MSVDIKLQATEIMQGALIGSMRQVQNTCRGLHNAYGAQHRDWQLHIEGALGEMALAKYLGVFYAGVGQFSGADVGEFQVRTRSKHTYDLILHPNDNDSARFWLLTGVNGQYRIHGWILGKDGKQQKYWKDPAGGRTAYFVPQSALQNVNDDVAAYT